MSEGRNPLEDDFLKQFALPKVDVSQFASGCIKSDAVQPTIQKLNRGFAQINSSIKREVALHESSLLDQTLHIETLENALTTVKEGEAY
jgi:hypothetical protein